MYKLLHIDRIVSNAPGNLPFFCTADLLAVAKDDHDDFSEEVKIACMAELLIRRYLNESRVRAEELDAVFPQKEWRHLELLLKQTLLRLPTRSELNAELWQSDGPFLKRCEAAVRARLIDLLENTDGFIPVYLKGDHRENTFFIPFHLEKADAAASSLPAVFDWDGQPIDDWCYHIDSLPDGISPYRCVVHCHVKSLPAPLSGPSMMLPLMMAYWRKTGILPPYNHLRLLATGEIKANRLVAVQVEEKLTALRNTFAHSYLLFPESSQFASEDAAALPLKGAMTTAEATEHILQIIEAKGMLTPTFRDAMRRLTVLEPEIRHDNHTRWQRMLERLNTNADAITERRAPEQYLLCLMLKSAIYCHMGRTHEALSWNRKAKAVAKRHGFDRQLLRLEIEELVELTDQEDFLSISALMAPLAQNVESAGDDDLLMRYHGTMGQAHCYGHLAGINGFYKEKGLEHFNRALSHAYRLNSEPDIAQDLNYVYLWHALFTPDSAEAATAHREAFNHIDRNLPTMPECRRKNLFFLRRFKLMALYRQLLLGKTLPHFDDEAEQMPVQADFWLRALSDKYLGAITAAWGLKEKAAAYFSRAESLLAPACGANMIIAYIRMTVLAEAFRSLGAEEYRMNALDSIKHLSPPYAATSHHWKNFLTAATPFPGLNYWY